MFADDGLEDYTSATDFTSNDPSMAYQYNNQTTGEILGYTSVAAYVDVMSADGCTCTGIQGCGDVELDDYTDVTVAPVITCGSSGNSCTPTDIWWFNGAAPGGYATSESFGLNQGSGNGAIAWSDTLTNSELSLSGTASPTLTATSSGYTAANSAGGTCIGLTVNGVSAYNSPVCFSVRAPVVVQYYTQYPTCDPGAGGGYVCHNYWQIKDQFQVNVPVNLPANEYWASGTATYPTLPFNASCTNGAQCNNWQQFDPMNPLSVSSGVINDFNYFIGGWVPAPGLSQPPSSCGSEIVKWPQQFYVGSQSARAGVEVEQVYAFGSDEAGPNSTDVLNYYLNCSFSTTQ